MLDFHELYTRYAADVHRFALFLSGNRALADDITSETFLRAWSSSEPDPRGDRQGLSVHDRAQPVSPRDPARASGATSCRAELPAPGASPEA